MKRALLLISVLIISLLSLAPVGGRRSTYQSMSNPVGNNATKDQNNPHFRSRFASLAAVRDVVIPALAAEGISVVQMPGNDEHGRVCVRTVLLYNSGQLDCGTLATTAAGYIYVAVMLRSTVTPSLPIPPTTVAGCT